VLVEVGYSVEEIEAMVAAKVTAVTL
jgi:hypothetical protein